MGCDVSPEQLWSWVDRKATELETHLSGCSRCRERAAEMRAEIDLITHAAVPVETPVPDRIGDYVVKRLIGEGGQALVYEAEQAAPVRLVALKVLKGGRFAGRNRLKRFVRETQTLARLKHPSIATIYETGHTEEGQHYFAMELVDGQPLDAYVRDNNLDREQILELLAKVCDAVHYAHRHDVIHRDLKPSNILVDAKSDPHVLDFGLARIMRPDLPLASLVTRPGVVEGTPRYMSPEQARGCPDDIGIRTDVYSLGVIGYELLTSESVYDVSGLSEDTVHTICEMTPKRPSTIHKELRGDLDIILLKALEKDPERRYQTVRAMAEDIRRHLSSDPIRARPSSLFYVLSKKLRKRRAATATVVIALLALAFGAVQMFGPSYDMEQARRQILATKCDLFEYGNNGRTVLRAAENNRRYRNHPEAFIVNAHALYFSKEPRFAMNVLELALVDNPTRWDCGLLLGEIYTARGVQKSLQPVVEDIAQLETAAGLYRGVLTTLDLHQSKAWAQEALSLEPTNPLIREAVVKLGALTGDHQLALRHVDVLIGLTDSPERWLEFKGNQLLSLGRFQEAVTVFQIIVTKKPRMPAGYIKLANTYRLIKDYPSAIEELTRAIDLLGEGRAAAWVYYHRGTPGLITGDLEQAAADYAMASRLLTHPTFGDARRFLILRELGRAGEATAVLDAAQARVGDNQWLSRVFACLAGNLDPSALVDEAHATASQRCEGYYYAGEACRLTGKTADSETWFRKCLATGLTLDPASPGDPMSEYELAEWRLSQLN